MTSVPQSKEELLSAINSIFPKLMADYEAVPESLSRKCELEGNVKGTQISVCDTVAYLVGWGKLVLKWHRLKSQGLSVDFPETGYKWNQLGLLAVSFQEQYSNKKYKDLLDELESTINEVVALISSLGNDQLYEKTWYEKWTLGRMIQFNTSSPMKNMRAKVRRFNKNNQFSRYCLARQANSALNGVLDFKIAKAKVSNLRMQAIIASIFGFPAVSSR